MKPERNSRETILVVEDDPMVLSSVRLILEEAGFCVLTAANSTEAIQKADGFYEPIHLLLSDVMMPDMSGPVISKILKKHRPEMRVMLMSGYPLDNMLFLNNGWQFIQKPFVSGTLVAKVNEMLGTTGHVENRGGATGDDGSVGSASRTVSQARANTSERQANHYNDAPAQKPDAQAH